MPKPVTIHLAGGKYYLPETLVLGPEDSGVTWQANEGETPIVSGGVKLDLKWTTYKEGILQAKVPDDLVTEELFVNGERQVLARYPNFDPKAKYFDGYAADAIQQGTGDPLGRPAGGYFMPCIRSCGAAFITYHRQGRRRGRHLGGRMAEQSPAACTTKVRFVENIFEELDAPGEWFLNHKTHTLYFYPSAGLDLANARCEAMRLATSSSSVAPRRNLSARVTLRGHHLRHATRTFMETKEPLLRSDWTIYRGGAIFFKGAEDCPLEDCPLTS